MSYTINFESSRVKEKEREETRKRRDAVLERAKADYEKKKAYEKNIDKKWMLPSVEARIDSESKGKKHKKTKKKKKKKKTRKSDSSDESTGEEEWTEKVVNRPTSPSPSRETNNAAKEKVTASREPAVRDEWMSLPSLLPCIRNERKPPEKRKDHEKMMLDTLGQSDRELNPYWKDGGAGLPSERKFEKKLRGAPVAAGTVGDRGANWLRRALKRAEEQATEEGRSLEAVAAERWGSLEKLKAMLADAETRSSRGPVNQPKDNRRYLDRRSPDPDEHKYRRDDKDIRRDNGSTRSSDNKCNTFKRPREDYECDTHYSDRKRDYQKEDRSGGKRDWEEKCPGMSGERSRAFQRPRDEEDYDRNNDESRRRTGNERNRYNSSDNRRENINSSDWSRTFNRPKDDEDYINKNNEGKPRYDDRRENISSGDRSRMFQRPKDYEDHSRNTSDKARYYDRDKSSNDRRENSSSSDRSKAFHRPRDDEDYARSTEVKARYEERERDKSPSERRETFSASDRSRIFQKPREVDEDRSSGGRFRKPTDDMSESRRPSQAPSSSSRRPNWKKPAIAETRQETSKKPRSSSSSSSSSSSDSETDTKKERPATPEAGPVALSEREMNDLGAKLIKAELLGNETLAAELRKKLDLANAARSAAPAGSLSRQSDGRAEKEVVILTRTDARGVTRPVSAATEPSGGRRRKQKMPTHDKEGKRVRYFADDDRMSLQDIFQKEKMNTVEDSNEMFATLAGKVKSNDDLEDLFEEKVSQQESAGRVEARERNQAIREFKRTERALDSCQWCFDSKVMQKHLVIAIGTKVYLSVPPYQSLTEGHCLIMPIHHVPCATQLDEDVWAEVQSFRRALTAMFLKMEQDVVYIETAMKLRNFPHMILECIPMPTETGHMAPIYFKKAILECEMEWSNNKKLVDTMGRDVRRAIPKGLPYFSVDFGNEGGFAHVIEEEALFPKYFAQEIVGGMLDLDHNLWRKPRRENFDAQRKKVLQFAEWWKPFDFTSKRSDSDSSSSSSSSE